VIVRRRGPGVRWPRGTKPKRQAFITAADFEKSADIE
jgi:hypothetical protein